jgi:ankyrin repeat protein
MSLELELFKLILSNKVNKLMKIKELVEEEGVNVNCSDKEGRTPLLMILNRTVGGMRASLTANDIDVIKYLIEVGADIKARDNYGNNCLHYACILSLDDQLSIDEYLAFLHYLLEQGIEVNTANNSGETPLLYFIRFTKSKHVLTILNLLLQHKANINTCDRFYNNILHKICDKYGSNIDITTGIQLIELAIQQGIDVNLENSSCNETPLTLAIAMGCREYINLFIVNKAKVRTKDIKAAMKQAHIMLYEDSQWIYKLSAHEINSPELIQKALEILDFCLKNYSFNKEDEEAAALLKFAVINMHPIPCVKVMESALAILLANSELLNDCLANAIRLSKLDVISYLLNHTKIDLKIWRYKGASAIELASELEIMQYLYEHGADINAVNSETGNTPLYAIVLKKSGPNNIINLINYLFELGADQNLPNKDNKTYNDLLIEAPSEVRVKILQHQLTFLLANKDFESIFNLLQRYTQQRKLETTSQGLPKPTSKNWRDFKSETMLHIMLKDGLAEFIPVLFQSQRFLQSNQDINAVDLQGDTALHLAVGYGYAEVASSFLQHGANPNLLNKKGLSAIEVAIVREQFACVKLLLQHGVPLNRTDAEGNVLTVYILLHRISKDLDIVLYEMPEDAQAITDNELLLWAVKNSCIQIGQILIEQHNADVNTKDNLGRTVLHHAANLLLVDFCRYLLQQGAEINAVDHYGNTVMHHLVKPTRGSTIKVGAKYWACAKLADLFIEHGVALGKKDKLGRSVLDLGTYDIEEYLHGKLSELNKKLLEAIKNSDIDAVETYLKLGANPGGRYYGNDALELAINQYKNNIVKLLIQYGANVNQQYAVHIAIKAKNLGALELLINAGANLVQQDKSGYTPIALARRIKQVTGSDSDTDSGEDEDNEFTAVIKEALSNRTRQLLKAILSNNYQEIEQLIKQGVNINQLFRNLDEVIHERPDYAIMGYLHYLIYNVKDDSDWGMLIYLIKAGCAIDLRNPTGLTPLHVAAQQGKVQAAKILINLGANLMLDNSPQVQPDLSWLSLLYAKQANQQGIIDLFFTRFIGINFPDEYDFLSLYCSRAIFIGATIAKQPITRELLTAKQLGSVDLLITCSKELKIALEANRFSYAELKDLYEYFNHIIKRLKAVKALLMLERLLSDKDVRLTINTPATRTLIVKSVDNCMREILKYYNKSELPAVCKQLLQISESFDFEYLYDNFQKVLRWYSLSRRHIMHLVYEPVFDEQLSDIFQAWELLHAIFENKKTFLKTKHGELLSSLQLLDIPAAIEDYHNLGEMYTKDVPTKAVEPSFQHFMASYTAKTNWADMTIHDDSSQHGRYAADSSKTYIFKSSFFAKFPPPHLLDKKIKKHSDEEINPNLLSHPCHQSLRDFLAPKYRKVVIELLLQHPRAIELLHGLLCDSQDAKIIEITKLDDEIENELEDIIKSYYQAKYKSMSYLDLELSTLTRLKM